LTQSEVGCPGWEEEERLSALRAYGVLDTEREAAFDDVVVLIARICEAPIAVVNLIDAERQWFKAEVGLGVRETPLATSFCAHALLLEDGMVVPDATRDPRFDCNPLVTGEPHLRFYAGRLLKTRDGLPLGTLCVLDTRPRPQGLTDLQQMALETLAGQVMAQMELRLALRQREQSEQTARLAIEASAYVGAWDWDIVGDRVTTDPQFAEMHNVDPDLARRGAPRETFLANVHPDDQVRVAREIDQALQDDGRYLSEYRVTNAAGETRWIMARGQVLFDDAGAPQRFPGIIVDISERRRQETSLEEIASALSESEARFRMLADAMPQMVWSAGPDGRYDYFNARWSDFTGLAPGSIDGDSWSSVLHPDDQARALDHWKAALRTGEPYEIECRMRRHDGGYRWALGRATATRNDRGEIVRWFGAWTDIDELKKLVQARELVSQELSHRIKNIFAVVTALVALSARQHPETREFAASLKTRIGALARAHEFVRPHTETSRATLGATTLHAFLADLFGAYADETGAARVKIAGDDAVFDDQAATSVALLFHELATNAAKYGALSRRGGVVDLQTRAEADRFILTWTECGGPEVTGPPTRAGFGSSLATLSVEGQLDGRLEREWRPEGLKVVVDLPSTALSRRRAAGKTT